MSDLDLTAREQRIPLTAQSQQRLSLLLAQQAQVQVAMESMITGICNANGVEVPEGTKFNVQGAELVMTAPVVTTPDTE